MPDNTQCCSFCGKPKQEVNTLIQGPNAYICDECVELCHGIIHQKKHDITDKTKILTPEKIKAKLDEYIIGQDYAKETIAVAIYNHHKRILLNNDGIEIDKSNILLLGPSGTGKTLISKTIAKMLDVPFVQVDATTLTESGYVGDDVESVIQRLLIAADFNVERAEQGIVYIDEIDKKAKKSESASLSRDVSGEGVQQALLKLVEGTKVRVVPGNGKKHAGQETVEVDTSKILFIVGGAFVGLEKIIESRTTVKRIGFGASLASNDVTVSNSVLPQDLTSFGLIPEFMGRFPIIVTLEKLSLEQLVHVMTVPKNNIVGQFAKLFEMDGVNLVFTADAIDAIAKESMKGNTGARGLRSIVEKHLMKLQFKLPTLAKEGLLKVTIDENTIINKEEPKLEFKK